MSLSLCNSRKSLVIRESLHRMDPVPPKENAVHSLVLIVIGSQATIFSM
jgi:hypothetical protein